MKTIKAQSFGRVNLIGEHTDYNGGWVLPTPIPQQTVVSLFPRADDLVFANSTNFEESKGKEAVYQLGEEFPMDSWVDYVQGVTKILKDQGFKISGFNAQVDSNIPIGSGLSSSAALEVSMLRALREAYSLDLPDLEIAKIGQRAENEFVGARVGIMDQMSCSLAKAGEALFIDTKTLSYEHIPLCLDKMDLLVINSGVPHQHAGGEYNRRRKECEEACHLLKIQQLRDLGIAELDKLEILPDVLKRRARHVITENQRVHEAVDSIKNGDVERLGQLFYASHESMARDYEVSIREIDILIELCFAHPDVFGARLTGGGFGGAIVAITKPGLSGEVGNAVKDAYQKRTSRHAVVLVSN